MDIIVPPTPAGQRLEALRIGDKVRFAEEAQRYTVRAVTKGGRFAICTKPFNLQRIAAEVSRSHRVRLDIVSVMSGATS